MKQQKMTIKGVLSIFSVMLLSAQCSILAAADITDASGDTIETVKSGDYEYSVMVSDNDDSYHAACIEKYTGSERDVVIPETLDGLEVIALGDFAFAGNYALQSVTLPSQIMGIGSYAFAECRALEEYKVAEGSEIFSVKDGVLYAHDDTWLVRYPIMKNPVNIEIPEGTQLIGDSALAYCDKLESITLPDSLTTIGIAAFSDCVKLNHITLPEEVTVIPQQCFYRCTGLDDITIKGAITEIQDAAFAETSIAEFEIPESCTTIGQAAFAATKLKYIDIPSSVTSIGYSAFGYDIDASRNFIAVDDFVIYGKSGTEASLYANDVENGNKFTFNSTGEAEDTVDSSESSNAPDAPDAPDASEVSNDTSSAAANDDQTESCADASDNAQSDENSATVNDQNHAVTGKAKALIAATLVGGAALLGIITAAIIRITKKSKKAE